MDKLYAAASMTDITPPPGIAHAGWGAQLHQRAEGVDMPMRCTALVLRKGDLHVAIVELDLIWLMPELDAAVRDAVMQVLPAGPDQIRISYSHTHSGPILDFTWMTEGDELIGPYVAGLPGRVASAVADARGRLVEARAGVGWGSCAINVNRRKQDSAGDIFAGRNWDGFTDRQVGVLALDDVDGAPIATVVNYACHGTTIGPFNRLITPDFPGPMRRVVEQNVGGLCLFLQGAAGNLHTVTSYASDVAVYRRAGIRLGLEAARVRMEIDPIPREEKLVRVLRSGADLGIYEDVPAGEPDGTLGVETARLELPVKEYPPVAEAQVEFDRRKAELVRARETGGEQAISEAVWPVRRAELALHHAKLFGGGKVELKVQGIRIGGAGLVCVPLEPFAEIGAEVKRRSPAPATFFSGYSNGYYGYLPTAEAFPLGGYEVRTSPYRADAAASLVESSLEVLGRLWS